MITDGYAQRLEDHYTRNWGSVVSSLRLPEPTEGDLPAEFRVLVFQPVADVEAFATICMSQPDDENRLELHVICRPQEQKSEIVEVLTSVAHYHRTGKTLGLNHTVNFGRPVVVGSSCTHGLISLPYLDGPALEWLETPKVQFLWLIPITLAELNLKKKGGIEALESRFEQAQFDYSDLFRASVV